MQRKPPTLFNVLVLSFTLVWLNSALFAQTQFSFELAKDDVLIVRKEQEILIGQKGDGREERNRIVLKVIDQNNSENHNNGLEVTNNIPGITTNTTQDSAATMEGIFSTYFRMRNSRSAFQRDKDYFSQFKILKNGQYIVPDKYIMPNLRSLPSFPSTQLQVGQTWQAEGMETIDIGDLKIKVPLMVRYKYIGPETVKDYYGKEQNAHKIVFVYELNHQVVPGNGPISLIQGRSTDEMWFSTENGIPVFDVQTIVYRFILKNKQTSESAYRIKSWYEKIRRIAPKEKEALTEQIKQQVEGHYSKNLQVRETDQGISLDLNNILFDVDSDKLRPEAQDTLNKVKDILAQHSNREIRIQGHTDNTGGKNYNIDLSTRRAKSVLDYLANQGLNTENMSYKGYGETKPVAPNITEEGKAKNRRVEILIVTE